MVEHVQSGNGNIRDASTKVGSPRADGASRKDDIAIAALRATMFLLPLAALCSTVLLRLGLEEAYPEEHEHSLGDLAVLLGVAVALCVWWGVARYYRRYTTAASASRRKYNR